MMRRIVLAAAFAGCAAAAGAAELGPPLACPPDRACYLQNLPDFDPSSAARDPVCGTRSYDGHDGVDLRVRAAAMRAGVAVLAPFSGRVLRLRDGEPDALMREKGKEALAGKDCGNGVVMVADDGDEVQMCHLRPGSIRVTAGQRVAAGDVVGLVGQSGRSAFPHVHMTLRRGGSPVDPGRGAALAGGVCTPGAALVGDQTAWSAAARKALPFDVRTRIVDWGFIAAPPARPQDADLAPPHDGSARAPALLFYGFFGGPQTGDVMRVRLLGPDGSVLAQSEDVQAKDQAQAARYVGKRTPPSGWPAGRYQGEATLLRGGREMDRRTETLSVR
ncbi:MAG: M23 family metallopeptidase [Alphaproteobacteria bacterium]|nr:M23 family metallopeptidase [Alphaproteobacteria bacterium]